jgi:hypothetical protein
VPADVADTGTSCPNDSISIGKRNLHAVCHLLKSSKKKASASYDSKTKSSINYG